MWKNGIRLAHDVLFANVEGQSTRIWQGSLYDTTKKCLALLQDKIPQKFPIDLHQIWSPNLDPWGIPQGPTSPPSYRAELLRAQGSWEQDRSPDTKEMLFFFSGVRPAYRGHSLHGGFGSFKSTPPKCPTIARWFKPCFFLFPKGWKSPFQPLIEKVTWTHHPKMVTIAELSGTVFSPLFDFVRLLNSWNVPNNPFVEIAHFSEFWLRFWNTKIFPKRALNHINRKKQLPDNSLRLFRDVKVTPSKAVGDLQRSGIRRSRLEPRGSLWLTYYCWWKKSCTSWYGKYPIIYRVLYMLGGAGFLPSTVG